MKLTRCSLLGSNLSRRKLLAGSAALSASGLLPEQSRAWLHPGAGGSTPFVNQGAFSGGGFNKSLSISNDASTVVTNYDGSNGWLWDSINSKWNNILGQTNVPGSAFNSTFRDWGLLSISAAGIANAPTLYALQVAPSDPSRLYAVAFSGNNYQSKGYIWKSIDKGTTWTNTGFGVSALLVTSLIASHGWGPTLVIDPVNPDIVFVGGVAGDIWKTTDGFASTFTCLSLATGPLNGALPTAVITNISITNTIPTYTFSATPSFIQNKNFPANGSTDGQGGGYNYQVAFWNITSTSGFVIASGFNQVNSFTTTTITAVGPSFQTTNIGDTLLFGWGPSFAFDPSSSSGGSTKTLYVSWGYGASSIYVTTDGGATFNPVASGGPAVVQAMACSTTGVLYAAENFTKTTPGWQLSAGTWTNYTTGTMVIPVTNNFASVACDPTNSSRALFGQTSGDVKITTNGGSSWFAPASKLPRIATDVPWMSRLGTLENSMSMGQIIFDPVTAGKLWFAEGIGLWTATCPANSSTSIQWTSITKGSSTLIIDDIVKPPGGNTCTAAQDRAGFVISDPTQEVTAAGMLRVPWLTIVQGYIDNGMGPSGYNGVAGTVLTVTSVTSGGKNLFSNCSGFSDSNMTVSIAGSISNLSGSPSGVGTFRVNSAAIPPQAFYLSFNQAINHGWSATYANSNPSFLLVQVTDYICISSDGGLNWFPAPTKPGGSQTGGCVAAQTTTNWVWFPEGNILPVYTTDGGNTWANCLFNGSTLDVGWTGSVYSNRHMMCADSVNPTTYWAYNWDTGGGNSGIWKSTDSGANWSKIAGTSNVLGGNTTDFNLNPVRGFAGHLMAAGGTSGGVAKWSVDGGGATWNAISNVQTGWQMCPGKTKPGNSYPSVYLAGILKVAADPTQTPGIFRSDNFDPANPGTMTPTWTRYCNAPGLNMDVPKCMCGDWDTYGSFWGGFGGTGYFYGKLV